MLGTQIKYEILRVFRNRRFIIASIVSPLMFYVIFTKITVGQGSPEEIKLWNAHYLMSMASFSIMGSAISTLGLRLVQERTQGWAVLMRVTPFKSSSYNISKMAAQLIVNLISILVIFTAGHFINNVSLDAETWLLCGLWILLASIPFLALGTLIGNFKRADTAAMLGNILYLGFAALGGMWMPLEIMPDTMQKIGKLLPSYRFGDGAWQIAAGEPVHWDSALYLAGYFALFVLLSSYMRKKQEAV